MPLPRYQPATKRLKVTTPMINNADDRCLSKIIGHALTLSGLRNDDDPSRENEQPEQQPIGYSTWVKSIQQKGRTLFQVETNDMTLIEHLIKSSDKICSKHVLESLKLTSPIKNLDLFMQLMQSKNLGTEHLTIVVEAINSFEQLADVRLAVENFKLNRPQTKAKCHLSLYLRDQKIPDCEDKIKNLVYLCRMADVKVYISALQRISIDCCHLMWSTGRALQSSDMSNNGLEHASIGCVFKITLKTYPLKNNIVNPCEITIPFGTNPDFIINQNREDLTRHKDIMRSIKKDCYNQFVKSVRENNNNYMTCNQ